MLKPYLQNDFANYKKILIQGSFYPEEVHLHDIVFHSLHFEFHMDTRASLYRIAGNFRGAIFPCFSANECFRGNIFVVAVCTCFINRRGLSIRG